MNYIYLIIYFIYFLFGYSVVTKFIKGEEPKYIWTENIFKRILALSLITLLINSLYYNDTENITLYYIAFILNIIVCVGYYIKFYPLSDPLTFIFHIVWAIPIFIAPLFYKITGEINLTVILILIALLLVYKFTLEDFVYN